jgi:UDP-N-acetylmuramate dehydrogenase
MLQNEVLSPIIPSYIQQNVSLADKNWFKTGGAARFYATPHTADEFKQALLYARDNNLEIFILGQGANILISDDGFNGLVIKPHINTITILAHENNDHNNNTIFVKADAGVTMPHLIDYCLDNNIIGLEEFSGIPGTVGGSVYINLHYFNFLLADFVISAEIIHKKNGTIHTVDAQWFNFGYDDSKLQKQDYFLLSATFKLTRASSEQTAFAQGRKTEIIRHRAHRYPQAFTCGSFFRNFLPEEVSLEINNKKIIFVAYYLDKIGVKGTLQIGDALVSHQHANMIINTGNATSADIIAVAREMQKLVQTQYNILPQPECQLVGFKDYPLF